MKETVKIVLKFFRKRPLLMCLSAALIVLTVDYITGRHIQFPIVYAVPVGMAAWMGIRLAAYALAVFLPLARVVFHFPWNESQSLPIAILNAFITLVSLLMYAYLIDKISQHSRTMEKELKKLEGILPICASCKRIRTDTGEYQQIEVFITENSEASFSHGICPDCASKLYPDFFKDKSTLG